MRNLFLAIALIANVICIFPNSGMSQACLELFPYIGPELADSSLFYVDSIKVDTCNNWRLYAKRGFSVVFDSIVLRIPLAPSDSVLRVSWQEIDTAYPAVRAGFQALEARFGSLHLRKIFPDDTGMYTAARRFDIEFDDYDLVDSILSYLDTIPLVQASFRWPSAPASVRRRRCDSQFSVFPNPAREHFHVRSSSGAFVKDIQIITHSGYTIYRVKVAPFSSDVVIELDHLRPGTYQVLVNEQVLPLVILK